MSNQRRQIGIHLPGIIKTLGDHLYSEKSVAIRELVQNANDSLVRRQIEDDACPTNLRIDIHTNNVKKDLLVIRDNGAGMTEQEIVNYLATVGRSQTAQLREAVKMDDIEQAHRLVGQFGTGFLSSFVIATSVEVRTRSYRKGQPGFTWHCDGGAEYVVSQTDGISVGTEVTLHLRPGYSQFANKDELLSNVRRYADFISFPIYFGDSPLPVNVQEAPWHKAASTAEYVAFVKERSRVEPMEVIPVSVVDGGIRIGGILYVPQTRQHNGGEVDLYVSRFYVGKDDNLLPDWATFVGGVIDTPSLDLTAGRETAVRNSKYERVQALTAERLSSFIESLARDDPSRFHRLVRTHEHAVKAGALEDVGFFSLVKDNIRFDSDAGKVTIPNYLERVGRRSSEPVQTIYYHEGGVESRQHQLLFAANGIPVLDAEERIDRAFIEKYAEETRGVRASSIDSSATVLFDSVLSSRFEHLLSRYADMKIEAKAAAFRPASVPALLVRKDGNSRAGGLLGHLLDDPDIPDELRRVFEGLAGARMRMHGRGWVLHLNTTNEVIRLMADSKDSEEIAIQCMREIYNSAYLVAAKGLSVQEVEKMARIHTETVAMLLNTARRLRESDAKTNKHGG